MFRAFIRFIGRRDQWCQFFKVVSLHDSAEKVMMAFVGNWPREVDPILFSSFNMPSIMNRIQDYISMHYPLRMPVRHQPYYQFDDLPRPTYKIVDSNIVRSSTLYDMIFCQVIPAHIKRMFKSKERASPDEVAWKLIEYYSGFPLAKIVFLLPWIHTASETAKKCNSPVIMVKEIILIQVYMGVENLLFDIYSDLPEGGLLSDKAVTKKLKSILVRMSRFPLKDD